MEAKLRLASTTSYSRPEEGQGTSKGDRDMGKYSPRPHRETVTDKDGGKKTVFFFMDNSDFNAFTPEVLGLGDITKPSIRVEALAASFDLTGFTKFCSQVDPHLCVPEFLSSFLDWLFKQLLTEFVTESHEGGKQLWASLPFMAKFTGDGVLFLWNTKGMRPTAIGNVIASLANICQNYEAYFYPEMKKRVTEIPTRLRCGVARGAVCSVGDREDYVGPCINIACRLNKLSPLSFCFSQRGLAIEKHLMPDGVERFLLRRVSIRGIGDSELVYVPAKEFKRLRKADREAFRTP